MARTCGEPCVYVVCARGGGGGARGSGLCAVTSCHSSPTCTNPGGPWRRCLSPAPGERGEPRPLTGDGPGREETLSLPRATGPSQVLRGLNPRVQRVDPRHGAGWEG